jgi:hypothetical protein
LNRTTGLPTICGVLTRGSRERKLTGHEGRPPKPQALLFAFLSRFFSTAAWGRRQLLALLLPALVIVYQINTGVLTISAVQERYGWVTVVKPHLLIVSLYLLVHAFLTAWRLDKERESEARLPVRLLASFQETKDLTISIHNYGPTDTFHAEIGQVYECHDWIRDVPILARWKGGGQNGSIEIPRDETRFIQVLTIPEDTMEDTRYPTVRVYRANDEVSSLKPFCQTGKNTSKKASAPTFA